MNVGSYLQRTYLLFFASIGLGLTLLCSLVELLEKLLYAPQASFSSIVTFVALNSVTTWLTILPITTWLAMVATIYQVSARKEWHVCEVLGIAPLRIVLPLFRLLCFLMLSVLVAKHLCLDRISWESRAYYQRVFSKKQVDTLQTISAQTADTLCRTTSFSQETNTGTDLTIYRYNGDSTLHLIEHAASFQLAPPLIYAYNVTSLDPLTNVTTIIPQITFSHEPFTLALTAQQPAQSLLDLLHAWRHTPASMPQSQAALVTAAQNDIRPLTEAFFLALCALLLFLLYRPHLFMILSTYPLLLGSTLALSYVCQLPPLAGTVLYAVCNSLLFAVAKAQDSRILRTI